MNITNAEELKKWLNRGKHIVNEIELLKEQREQSESRITSLSRPLKNDDALVAHADFARDIGKRIRELTLTLKEIDSTIERIGEAYHLHKNILRIRYVLIKSRVEVAEQMNYSVRHIGRLTREAIAILLEQMAD